MAITTHAELITAVGNWLNRSDLASIVPDFITLFEARVKRDLRARKVLTASVNVTADAFAFAPTGFGTLLSLAHDGPTYYGPLEIVSREKITDLKVSLGATGVPQAVAVVNSTGYFAPAPNATFAMKATYRSGLTALSAGSNWLIATHPDIYLYGTLVEAAPYLIEDERVPLWESQLNTRLEDLYLFAQEEEFGAGPLTRQFEPIGG